MRRRAHVQLTEEDLFHLLALNPNEHVVSVWANPMCCSICIGVEGDDTSEIPESSEGTVPPRIERPYAMAKLRTELINIVAPHLRQERELTDECLKAIGKRVVEEVFPSLTVSSSPTPTVP